eukprot:66970-Alexandrium_andersonii.AAC.1
MLPVSLSQMPSNTAIARVRSLPQGPSSGVSFWHPTLGCGSPSGVSARLWLIQGFRWGSTRGLRRFRAFPTARTELLRAAQRTPERG